MVDQDGFRGFLGVKVAGVGGRDLSQPYFGVRLDEIRRLDLHEARL
jgi:hypothetical protein